ncbi:S8 family peptidase [Desertibacillus haloalkaliphilus]|uniref:S8 family peptidase n=1 Tax=Desertibacillus haloalkaliphilus TaxID=1328930 RepID=UPI001C26059D|nr:S8 family peptidase [Desertibacillus haloalkaliphilus]MBU8908780.1 S8 family peptidase [Desertibacillus haloalkaliphilus]
MFDRSMVKVARDFGEKIDRSLRKKLVGLYKPMRWTPCFLHGSLEKLFKKIKRYPVVIEFEGGEDTFWSGLNEVDEILMHHKRCRRTHEFERISCGSFILTAEAIEELCYRCHSIKKIHDDREFHALLDVASPSIHANLVNDQGYTGNGVTVAVIDTGIHPHSDLLNPENRIVGFRDFINGREEPYDDNGHGTHCAGDAVGNGYESNGQYHGPAPEANVVGVKVLNSIGSGTLSTIIQGVEWCIENREEYGIDIISMSLGSHATEPAEEDPVVRIVERAWEEGIVVCVAAGNSGPNPQTIASPAISPRVITVGAMDDQDTVERSDDRVAAFSSRGPTIDGLTKPDLLAPGVDIVSLLAPDTKLAKLLKKDRVGEHYIRMSGTSMATPICAGVVALMLERDPELSPDQVKKQLLKSAEDWGLEPHTQGEGYIDAHEAVL